MAAQESGSVPKRSSLLMFPQKIIDFRGSWPAFPVGRPSSTIYLPQNAQYDKQPLERIQSVDSVDALKGSSARIEEEEVEQVVGSTELYDKNGNIRLIPTPTPDPRDPLNLPNWRKWAAIAALCLFGSVSLAAEIAVATLTPVFLLEYSGVDAAAALKSSEITHNPNPLSLIPPNAAQQVSLAQVALLATIPMLSNGVATYFLVPLSTAIGRRPVLLLTSTLSWMSGFWAGTSHSLMEHIAARVFHGLGSGAVEALLPLIIQDITFIHQRNKAIAAIFAAQGPMIVLFGTLSPWLAVNHTWRWVYFITSGIGIFAWIFIILLVPESRVERSKEELAGKQIYPIAPGEGRTRLDYSLYTARTRWDDLGMFNYGFQWRQSLTQLLATFKTIVYPAVIWATLLQTVMGIGFGAAGQVTSFALLASGVPFELTGLSNLSNLLTPFVIFLLGGVLSDKVILWVSKRRGGREPEYQLVNLIIPVILSIVGSMVFAYADQHMLHYTILLTGVFLMLTAPLLVSPIVQNFVMESYPQWAGPVLTNVSTLRVFTGFYFNTQVTTWFAQFGPINFMAYLSAALLIVSLGIPVFFFYGKTIRRWTSGSVPANTRTQKSMEEGKP